MQLYYEFWYKDHDRNIVISKPERAIKFKDRLCYLVCRLCSTSVLMLFEDDEGSADFPMIQIIRE